MTPSPRLSPERIVAVGLLTQRDVETLGTGFRRLFPLDGPGAFDDLLKELDRLDAVPVKPARPR